MICINNDAINDIASDTKEQLSFCLGDLKENNIQRCRERISECIGRMKTLEDFMDYSLEPSLVESED